MAALKLRRRHRLRRKEIIKLSEDIEAVLGCKTFSETDNVETADAGDHDLILFNGVPFGIFLEGEPFLLIRGILKFLPDIKWVEVDMGAVKFLANGADVMSPGIVDADPSVAPGDGVWIRDERNKKPLAVGIAQLTGSEMVQAKSGKAIKTEHFIGDKIWKIGEE
ncbi:MAG: RNA-binding protein [Thermoplasmata archaeon]|nr:RNA-binding protein [Thermoplasmata archaeon]